MAEEKVIVRKAVKPDSSKNDMFPRTINAASRTKEAMVSTGPSNSFQASYGAGSSGSTYRTPSNRFYSPDITTSSIYLPRSIENKNLWRRWIVAHDPIVGSVAEAYTDMPWSKAEIHCDDPAIQKIYQDAVEDSNFFMMAQNIDLEMFKIGEAIVVFNWNEKKGYLDHIVIQNPNFIDIKGSPLVGDQPEIYLKPDSDLKKIIMSTDPVMREKKKQIDRRILESVMWGRNIQLPPEYTIHLCRRENPTDLRGSSIIDRVFKIYMLEDKILEGVLTSVDNHMFPLKIFKLGDPATHWIPPEEHSRALADMLQQQQFDPNFALIWHYGLTYEQHGMDGKIMRFDTYFDRIDKLKMIALGVNNAFLTGDTTYASANSFMQVMLSRLKTKRDMYEATWMKKFFKVIAEKNGFYKREKKEIVGRYRTSNKNSELILPRLAWQKSLSMRDDQSYLQYLRDLYDKGKGPVSVSTLLAASGLETKIELQNKKNDHIMELQLGAEINETPPAQGGNDGLFAAFKGKRDKQGVDLESNFFVGNYRQENIDRQAELTDDDSGTVVYTTMPVIDDNVYLDITDKYAVNASTKKAFADVVRCDKEDLRKVLSSIYEEGKIKSYNTTNYLDLKLKIASMTMEENNGSFVMDIQDDILIEDIVMSAEQGDKKRTALDAFFLGQIQGLAEQGIEWCSLRYADNNNKLNGRKLSINDLLNANTNWGSELYPNFEYVSIEPEITNFENHFAMTEIPTVETISSNKILIENVPIEYKQAAYKMATILPASIKKIKFVSDITSEKEWTDWRRDYYKATGFGKPEDEALIIGLTSRDIKNNRDRLFVHKGTMFIDYTIGRKDGLFEDLLSSELASTLLNNETVKEALASDYSENLEAKDMSLKPNDIEVLAGEEYLLPINDKISNKVVGWQINKDKQIDESSVYCDIIKEGLMVNGRWNVAGTPLFHVRNISSINKFLVGEISDCIKLGTRNKRVEKVFKYL